MINLHPPYTLTYEIGFRYPFSTEVGMTAIANVKFREVGHLAKESANTI